jgi:hypothetical protein
MLTSEQRAEFDQFGLLHIPDAIAKADIEQMNGALWAALESEHGMRRDAPESWQQGRASGIQAPARSNAFAAMGGPAVSSALDELFRPGGWEKPRRWGQPLVTFPNAGKRWDVIHSSWHMDARAERSAPRLPGVVVFAYLDAVLERGGGTLAVAGSHRLVEQLARSADPDDEGRSADVHKTLMRAHPWLRALWTNDEKIDRVERFMVRGAKIGGTHMRVIEMTGEAGDVIIWHPWLFHTAASNCRERPRLMLRQQIIPSIVRAA